VNNFNYAKFYEKMLGALSDAATAANQASEGAVSWSNEVRQKATFSEIKKLIKISLRNGLKTFR
jgi:hypothetical protein